MEELESSRKLERERDSRRVERKETGEQCAAELNALYMYIYRLKERFRSDLGFIWTIRIKPAMGRVGSVNRVGF